MSLTLVINEIVLSRSECISETKEQEQDQC